MNFPLFSYEAEREREERFDTCEDAHEKRQNASLPSNLISSNIHDKRKF